jgi:hypothetical protein
VGMFTQRIGKESLEGIGGADGVRTHDLLDAIEARSQLRHGPTVRFDFSTGLSLSKFLLEPQHPPCNPRFALQVLLTESKLITE